MRRLWRAKNITVGGLIFFSILLMAILAGPLAPGHPSKTNVRQRLAPPGSEGHLLGTDHLGRDVLSRLLYGARVSLLVGFASASSASILGLLLGLTGGYGGRIGLVVMRLVDGLMAFPGLLLALAMMAVLGARMSNIIIALAIVYAPRVARIAHAKVVQIRSEDYVLAAIAVGAGHVRVIIRHILPNAVGAVLIQATFLFALAIIAEAGLSFLGVGAPPFIPSWGNTLSDGRAYMLTAGWITLYPGLLIFLVVLSLNLLGDGLRDLLDPRTYSEAGLQ